MREDSFVSVSCISMRNYCSKKQMRRASTEIKAGKLLLFDLLTEKTKIERVGFHRTNVFNLQCAVRQASRIEDWHVPTEILAWNS